MIKVFKIDTHTQAHIYFYFFNSPKVHEGWDPETTTETLVFLDPLSIWVYGSSGSVICLSSTESQPSEKFHVFKLLFVFKLF